jgi:hypothetical protein
LEFLKRLSGCRKRAGLEMHSTNQLINQRPDRQISG